MNLMPRNPLGAPIFLLALFAVVAAAQSPPQAVLRVGVPDLAGIPSYTTPAGPVEGTHRIALDIVPGQGGPTIGAWHVIVPRAHVQNENTSLLNEFVGSRSWLLDYAHPNAKDALATVSGSVFDQAAPANQRIRNSDIDALANRTLHVDPQRMNTFVYLATGGAVSPAAPVDKVKEFFQPFLDLGATPSHRFWKTWCAHWADPTITASGIANYYWSPAFYQAVNGDIFTGEHVMSVGRLAEMAFLLQAPTIAQGRAFLQGIDYRRALDLGVVVELTVITLRGPAVVTPGFTPLGAPGLLGAIPSFAEFSFSDPVSLSVPIGRPDGPWNPPQSLEELGDIVYFAEPATLFPEQPGTPMLVLLGPAADVDTAVFPVETAEGPSTVNVPLAWYNQTVGMALVTAPLDAIPGMVDFIKVGLPVPVGVAVNPLKFRGYDVSSVE